MALEKSKGQQLLEHMTTNKIFYLLIVLTTISSCKHNDNASSIEPAQLFYIRVDCPEFEWAEL
jgi:hypothetical protein